MHVHSSPNDQLGSTRDRSNKNSAQHTSAPMLLSGEVMMRLLIRHNGINGRGGIRVTLQLRTLQMQVAQHDSLHRSRCQ